MGEGERITPDILSTRANDPSVLFTFFVHKVATYGDSRVYCFVEDYDMPYFSSLISVYLDKEWTSIRCKGKSAVIAVYEYLKDLSEYEKYTKRFFVDADFDNNSAIEDAVYITPGYSIENFYVQEESIARILEAEYEVDPVEDKELFDKTMDFYRKRIDQFHHAVVKYNAWYACLHSLETWDHRDVYLGDKFPSQLLRYNMNSDIISTYTLSDIEVLHNVFS